MALTTAENSVCLSISQASSIQSIGVCTPRTNESEREAEQELATHAVTKHRCFERKRVGEQGREEGRQKERPVNTIMQTYTRSLSPTHTYVLSQIYVYIFKYTYHMFICIYLFRINIGEHHHRTQPISDGLVEARRLSQGPTQSMW
jgi:hypothetical protein